MFQAKAIKVTAINKSGGFSVWGKQVVNSPFSPVYSINQGRLAIWLKKMSQYSASDEVTVGMQLYEDEKSHDK